MKLSRLAIVIKLNTKQPASRDDLYWQAFGMVVRGVSNENI